VSGDAAAVCGAPAAGWGGWRNVEGMSTAEDASSASFVMQRTDTGAERTHRPRLVAIDVDHTLLRSDRTLAQETVAAAQVARAAGIQLTLASSRPPGGMWQYLQALGIVAPSAFVGFQGALVASFDADGRPSVIATTPIELAVAGQVAEAARSLGVATSWYTPTGWFVDEVTDEIAHEGSIVGMAPQLVADFDGLEAPVKILFIARHPEEIEALRRVMPASVTAETSNAAYLEITARGVDKATGVEVIAGGLDVPFSEVVAIGDGRNDLGLFRRVGTSVAPANADPSVLAEADYIAPSNDADGVAATLRWLAGLPVV